LEGDQSSWLVIWEEPVRHSPHKRKSFCVGEE
jgi:hypothetical protein